MHVRQEGSGTWGRGGSFAQRGHIGFERALVQKPDGLFLDEATAAVDEATEACLYRLLRERLARTTAFSVRWRTSL